MQTTPWSSEHARAVSDAAPAVPPADRQELDRTWARIHAALPASPRRRRRTRILMGAGVAAALVGGGGAAAAAMYSAHTDPAAPGYDTIVARAAAGVPFPTERARESFVRTEVRLDRRGMTPGETSVSTKALRFWAARSAVCAWADRWAAATTAGDTSAKAQAATMLEQAPTWPAVTDVDPTQVIRYESVRVTDPATGVTTTQRLPDNTAAGYFPLVRAAALADDVTAMGSVLARWGSCQPYGADMPHFPQALPHE
jgi:hypothetical protein